MAGLSVTALCVPAREVGGDYYDFLPLDDQRVGVLIADVSGKGTSAALYMAELKGLVLSLSEIHTSPRELLIAAEPDHRQPPRRAQLHHDDLRGRRSARADDDLRARRPHAADLRAGHLRRRRRRASVQILVPDGMVVGLKLDNGEMFERLPGRGDDPAAAGRSLPAVHRRHQRGDERARRSVRRVAARPAGREPRAPAVRGAARARAARDRRVRRRRAAARRHDDDPAEGRRAGPVARDRRELASSRSRMSVASSRSRDRLRRHLPHPLRHRSADRPRPARDARRDVGGLVRRAALDLPAVGRRPQRGAHRGARRARPRRRSASSRRTAPS